MESRALLCLVLTYSVLYIMFIGLAVIHAIHSAPISLILLMLLCATMMGIVSILWSIRLGEVRKKQD